MVPYLGPKEPNLEWKILFYPSELRQVAAANLAAFQYAKNRDFKLPHREERDKKWQAPPIGQMKVNVNFTCDEGTGMVGLRVVIQDGQGSSAATKFCHGVGTVVPESGKMMALREER